MNQVPRQYVRFLFLRLDPAWRRLDPALQSSGREELAETILRYRGRMLLRTYSLAGTRGDADLMLWQASDSLEVFQGLQTEIFSTRLGAHLHIAHSFLGTVRRSVYELPESSDEGERVSLRPQDSRFLFVYPFVKTREWYALPLERRQAMMEEHIRIGRKYPGFRLNTLYSFGLDDQEFVVAFEGDEPADFVSMVMELRESEASRYTLRDTPAFTCIQMSIRDALDSLGGAHESAQDAALNGDEGFQQVASLEEIPDGGARRAYLGSEAIAIFRVNGRVHAVSDRCPHGRASLSEGILDPARNILTCPWHGGQFDVCSGQVCSGPPRAPLKVYQVRLDGRRILVR
jgi:chlorite dismutase